MFKLQSQIQKLQYSVIFRSEIMTQIENHILETINKPTTSKWLKKALESVLEQDNLAQLWIDTQSLNRIVTSLILTKLNE